MMTENVDNFWKMDADIAPFRRSPPFIREAILTLWKYGDLKSKSSADPFIIGIAGRRQWLVNGKTRQLYVWEINAPPENCRLLTLPSCGLHYHAEHVFVDEDFVICVSAEGTLRLWRDNDINYIDTNCNLNGQVVHSVKPYSEKSKIRRFVIATTNGCLYIATVTFNKVMVEELSTSSVGVLRYLTSYFINSASIDDNQSLKCTFSMEHRYLIYTVAVFNVKVVIYDFQSTKPNRLIYNFDKEWRLSLLNLYFTCFYTQSELSTSLAHAKKRDLHHCEIIAGCSVEDVTFCLLLYMFDASENCFSFVLALQSLEDKENVVLHRLNLSTNLDMGKQLAYSAKLCCPKNSVAALPTANNYAIFTILHSEVNCAILQRCTNKLDYQFTAEIDNDVILGAGCDDVTTYFHSALNGLQQIKIMPSMLPLTETLHTDEETINRTSYISIISALIQTPLIEPSRAIPIAEYDTKKYEAYRDAVEKSLKAILLRQLDEARKAVDIVIKPSSTIERQILCQVIADVALQTIDALPAEGSKWQNAAMKFYPDSQSSTFKQSGTFTFIQYIYTKRVMMQSLIAFLKIMDLWRLMTENVGGNRQQKQEINIRMLLSECLEKVHCAIQLYDIHNDDIFEDRFPTKVLSELYKNFAEDCFPDWLQFVQPRELFYTNLSSFDRLPLYMSALFTDMFTDLNAELMLATTINDLLLNIFNAVESCRRPFEHGPFWLYIDIDQAAKFGEIDENSNANYPKFTDELPLPSPYHTSDDSIGEIMCLRPASANPQLDADDETMNSWTQRQSLKSEINNLMMRSTKFIEYVRNLNSEKDEMASSSFVKQTNILLEQLKKLVIYRIHEASLIYKHEHSRQMCTSYLNPLLDLHEIDFCFRLAQYGRDFETMLNLHTIITEEPGYLFDWAMLLQKKWRKFYAAEKFDQYMFTYYIRKDLIADRLLLEITPQHRDRALEHFLADKLQILHQYLIRVAEYERALELSIDLIMAESQSIHRKYNLIKEAQLIEQHIESKESENQCEAYHRLRVLQILCECQWQLLGYNNYEIAPDMQPLFGLDLMTMAAEVAHAETEKEMQRYYQLGLDIIYCYDRLIDIETNDQIRQSLIDELTSIMKYYTFCCLLSVNWKALLANTDWNEDQLLAAFKNTFMYTYFNNPIPPLCVKHGIDIIDVQPTVDEIKNCDLTNRYLPDNIINSERWQLLYKYNCLLE